MGEAGAPLDTSVMGMVSRPWRHSRSGTGTRVVRMQPRLILPSSGSQAQMSRQRLDQHRRHLFARWSSIRDQGRQGLGDDRRFRRRTPMGGYLQEKQLLLIPSRFAIAMEDDRWILRNDLIWFKPNVPPRPETDRLRLAHEHFFHFVKRPKEGRAKYYYDLSGVEGCGLDVVTCNARPGRNGHSATFPADLIEPRISSSCPADGFVLDPFCGTGSAVRCAAELGRRALGFELVERFDNLVRRTRRFYGNTRPAG